MVCKVEVTRISFVSKFKSFLATCSLKYFEINQKISKYFKLIHPILVISLCKLKLNSKSAVSAYFEVNIFGNTIF